MALFQKANTSQLVTGIITQELLQRHQARGSWNYNRATPTAPRGGKLNKQALPAGSGTGGATPATAAERFTDTRTWGDQWGPSSFTSE